MLFPLISVLCLCLNGALSATAEWPGTSVEEKQALLGRVIERVKQRKVELAELEPQKDAQMREHFGRLDQAKELLQRLKPQMAKGDREKVERMCDELVAPNLKSRRVGGLIAALAGLEDVLAAARRSAYEANTPARMSLRPKKKEKRRESVDLEIYATQQAVHGAQQFFRELQQRYPLTVADDNLRALYTGKSAIAAYQKMLIAMELTAHDLAVTAEVLESKETDQAKLIAMADYFLLNLNIKCAQMCSAGEHFNFAEAFNEAAKSGETNEQK